MYVIVSVLECSKRDSWLYLAQHVVVVTAVCEFDGYSNLFACFLWFDVSSVPCALTFFFFNHKTEYELRISDWSSDVCSSDLLLFRALPGRMIEDGYRPTKNGSMTSAAMAFMRDHGVLKDIYSESTGTAHKTAKGTKVSVRTVKAPGFGPKGVLRCVLPFTVFLKLKDIGGNVLPPYDEEFREVAMDTAQAAAYRDLAGRLTQELKQALAKRDTTLLGVVLNVLLAWPDCCFRSETVVHPRTRNTLAFVPAQFNELEVMPKERELHEICRQEKAEGRTTMVY